jgi:coproporphyrinogen III oxidase-like Fe-S oxidoreductase
MLRLDGGIEYAMFERKTGRDPRDAFRAQLERLEHVGLVSVNSTTIKLTNRGIAVADAIASEFLPS